MNLEDFYSHLKFITTLTVFAIVMVLIALFLTTKANAVEATINYSLPTVDCNGDPLVPGVVEQLEIYISASPIPASDHACADDEFPPDEPPASFSTRIERQDMAGSVTVDLIGGTYYARARVLAPTLSPQWSNFSSQHTITIPLAPPAAPFIINVTF